MGIWGFRLFEDDCALDVRGEFKDHLGDGLSPAAATRKTVESWKPDRDDPQEYASFWLALAATQWDLGRLTPLALRRALAVIDREIGLDAYGEAGPKALAARRRVYRAIRAKLLRKPPAPKVVPRRVRATTDLEAGDLVEFKCLSGRLIYLRVLGIHTDRGGSGPIVDVCNWRRQGVPSKKAISAVRSMPATNTDSMLRHVPIAGYNNRRFMFWEGRRDDGLSSRLRVLSKRNAFPDRTTPCTVMGKRSNLDRYLLEEFSIR